MPTALQVRGAGLQSAVEAARAQLNGLKNQEAAAGDVAQKLTEERDAAAEHLKECEEAVTRNDNIRSGLKLKLESPSPASRRKPLKLCRRPQRIKTTPPSASAFWRIWSATWTAISRA